MHRRSEKLQNSFFPKCFTLCYKLCGWVVQSSFFQNVCYLEVSAIGSTGLFVDLDQENASVWSPSPETNLEKRGPPRQATRRRHDDKPSPSIRSTGGPPCPVTHTHTRARRSNKPLRHPPRSDSMNVGEDASALEL